MTSRISHTSFDAINAYAQSVFWSQVLDFAEDPDDPNLPGEMQTTICISPVSCGVELNITQEGIPAVIPAEACYLGWQESLTLLAQLVEAEIPD